MLTLLVAWCWRGKTRSANQKQKTEKPIVPSFCTRHSRFFSSVSNTDNNSTTERLIRIPLGACGLVVWQCIAFATSFLLASQTTSVAAAASCMTTSYTTTKLSHSPMSKAPGKRGTAHQSYAMWRERTRGLGATSLHVIWGIDD